MKSEADSNPETYFAPAGRTGGDELVRQVEEVTHHPLVNTLLNSVGGLLAVLNQDRQLLAINDLLLEELRIDDSGAALGLRLGEVAGCTHARKMAGGCGTSRYCSTCGVAIATVSALEQDRPSEERCCITSDRQGEKLDLYFHVRACPITVEGSRFILLFLQDVTADQRWSALERTFFHDINNVAGALLGNAELLERRLGSERKEASLVRNMVMIANRLREELALQQVLIDGSGREALAGRHPVSCAEICSSLQLFFASHPLRLGKEFDLHNRVDGLTLESNQTLIVRILTNMLINAFEATPEAGTVTLSVLQAGRELCCSVWNAGAIPEEISLRIFQRNFSSKAEKGRGLGTFSMKLFAEEILGGRVVFESTKETGTTFSLFLPL